MFENHHRDGELNETTDCSGRVLLHDPENPNAWIRSDTTTEITQ